MESTCTLTKRPGLSETGLKWIALVTMVLDHIHYFFGFTGAIPEWFSMVGRLGAPLFLFRGVFKLKMLYWKQWIALPFGLTLIFDCFTGKLYGWRMVI